MKSSFQASKNVSILDSDDELPDSYEETSEVPAYLNDSRFDHIELPWLNNCKPIKINEQQQLKTSQERQDPIQAETKCTDEPNILDDADKIQSRILISQGVLSSQDLYFVKSIEQYCSESTLIWFIESLKNKSVSDRFRKSCLARDLNYAKHDGDELDSFDAFNTNYYFNLIVL